MRHVGGTVEGALKGEHKLSPEITLKAGWELAKPVRFVFIKALLSVFGAGLLMVMVLMYVGQEFGYNLELPEQQLGLQYVVSILLAPLLVGIEMMGLHRAIGGNVKTSELYYFMGRSAILVIASMLTSALGGLGTAIFLPIGAYISFSTMFVPMLMMEKNFSVFRAIHVSIVGVSRVFLSLFLTILPVVATVVILAFVLVASQALLPLGLIILLVSLVFIVPWFYVVKGLIYCEVFGVDVAEDVINPDASID